MATGIYFFAKTEEVRANYDDDALNGHKGETYQSPVPPALPVPLVSLVDWPAAAEAKLDGRFEGILAFKGDTRIESEYQSRL